VNYRDFQELIWQKADELYRDMPWRQRTDPYWVLVSELMLQQTQVDRVIPKFEAFMQTFPTLKTLAEAPLSAVLAQWNGLGYNRRAKFLHVTAQKVMTDFGGSIPNTYTDLITLSGIGPNTAGAILNYSYNVPTVFIETNVRTVYFHHFYQDSQSVSDAELKVLVEATIDQEHPREWYWALMDYGSYLKRHGAGSIDKSAHYKKQAPLKGSLREVRGVIIHSLASGDREIDALRQDLPQDERFERALADLKAEGLVQQTGSLLHLP